LTEEDRDSFLKSALEYLRDPDAVTEPHVQARIADELERLARIVREARKLLGENFEQEMTND